MNNHGISIDVLGFQLFDKWLYNLRAGKRIARFFEDNNYKKISIYGMGLIGRQVYSELQESAIDVVCGIDQRAKSIEVNSLKIVLPEEASSYPYVDAIVVTPIHHLLEIEELLYRKGFCGDVISIEQVIEYVFKHE